MQHLAVLAALRVNRPVKAKLTRQESINFHPKRHYMEGTFTLGCDENGIFTGLDCEIHFDTGAYASPVRAGAGAGLHPLGGPLLLPEHRHPRLRLVHQQPLPAFRGFGVCQSEFALESNINLLAEKVGISPGRSASATPSSRGGPSPTARSPTAPPPSRRPCWR